jgi:hypothetical protein
LVIFFGIFGIDKHIKYIYRLAVQSFSTCIDWFTRGLTGLMKSFMLIADFIRIYKTLQSGLLAV